MSQRYPFDKFTADAKRALVCAQQEAEDDGAGYIGTQHLLLGLLRVGSGSAVRALRSLGIDEMKLWSDIRVLQESSALGGPIPSKATQHAIEYAFRESAARGDAAVRTGHLLAGIVSVQDGAGAAALKRQWCEPGAVMTAVDRELRLR